VNDYITGYHVNAGTFGGFTFSTGGAFFMKFNSAGTVQWLQETVGSSGVLTATVYSIAIDHSGNCIAAGVYSSAYADFGTIHIVNNNGLYQNWRFATKMNSTTGDFIWAIGDGMWQSTCGNYSVSTDAFDNIYLTGPLAVATEGTGSSASISVHFVEKLNAAGVSQWIQQYGWSSTFFPSIKTDHSGNSFVAISISDTTTYGSYTIIPNSPFGSGTVVVSVILKIDNGGNVVFAKASENPGSFSLAIPTGIDIDDSDNAYITNAQFLLARLGSTPAGINEMVASDFLIYPNPAQDVLNIQYDINSEITASVVDMIGKEVMSQKLTPVSAQMNISMLDNGIYNIILLNAKGGRSSQRFIIQ
jgi:Secretion system C-terminal sorting domain